MVGPGSGRRVGSTAFNIILGACRISEWMSRPLNRGV